MKKLLSFIISIIITATALSLLACAPSEPLVVKESDTYIVIKVDYNQLKVEENAKLVDYMLALKEDGKLDFEMKNGMVTSINGIENPSDWSSCWMFYTDDAENSSTWYTVEYKGKIYGSANYGAEDLVIKDGYTYILYYQSF